MRIAICTRLRIPIIICNRANSSSFASCGMRQLCADAEDVALVWQNEHRHAVKTTESGHKRSSTHGGKENLVAHHDLSLWSFILKNILHLQSDRSHLSNLYPSTKKTHTRLSETNTLASTRVKCHWGTYWGVDGRRFPEVQPSMRKRTYSTGREKSAGPGSHTYIQMSLSGHNSTTGQRFVTDHGLLPHPPSTFIKNPTPMSVFFFFFFLPKILQLFDKWVKQKHNK